MPTKVFKAKHPDYELLRHLRGSVIVIDSIIGGGKTSLGLKLSKYLETIQLPVKFFEEEVDEEFLELFLQDKKKYAFAFQMFMLSNRQKVYMSAVNFAHQHNGVSIVDRSLLGDAAFCDLHHDYGNISNEEWTVYQSVINRTQFPSPSVILYLEVEPKVALDRIKQRNRGSEVSVYTEEYLEDLDTSYKTIFAEHGGDVTYVDWNDSRSLDREDLLEVCQLLDPRE